MGKRKSKQGRSNHKKGKPNQRRRSRLGKSAPRGKVSDALVHIAQPLLDQEAQDLTSWTKTLNLAMLVWNTLVTRDSAGKSMFVRLPKMLSESTGLPEEVCADIAMPMAERKLAAFPDDERFVVDVRVEERPDGRFYVEAASMRTAEVASIGT